jgi:predicted nucleic acid-binding protein
VLTSPYSIVFSPAKDRPILLTAFANAAVLLTLDRQDFVEQIGSWFYSLRIMTPAELIRVLRSSTP